VTQALLAAGHADGVCEAVLHRCYTAHMKTERVVQSLAKDAACGIW